MLEDLIDALLDLFGLRKVVGMRFLAQHPSAFAIELIGTNGRRVRKTGVWIDARSSGAWLTGRSARTEGGVAVFSNLTMHPMEDEMPFTLTFQSPNLPDLVSAPITLTPVVAGLRFVTPPPATAEDAKLFPSAVVVELVSAKGNAVPREGVTVTVAPSTGAQVVGPTSRITDAQGRATFNIGVDDLAL